MSVVSPRNNRFGPSLITHYPQFGYWCCYGFIYANKDFHANVDKQGERIACISLCNIYSFVFISDGIPIDLDMLDRFFQLPLFCYCILPYARYSEYIVLGNVFVLLCFVFHFYFHFPLPGLRLTWFASF